MAHQRSLPAHRSPQPDLTPQASRRSAPATFGSPQAEQGRSWLGALVKGNKDLGPDFLNAGDQVLLGLELASSYTLDLAHKDMLIDPPLYQDGPNTPYVTVFIGNIGYTGISAVANSPGSDGTVRWAGCALNTRKVSFDLRRSPRLIDAAGKPTRCTINPWAEGRIAAPMIAVDGKNHGTIISAPDPNIRDFIVCFLHLSTQTMTTPGRPPLSTSANPRSSK